MSRSLISSCLISFHYIPTLSLPLSLHTHTLIDGHLLNHSGINVGNNDIVNIGDEWSMEVDLRSREKEKRTLHWFVRGKQQKGFIKGVPDRVEFIVCYSISPSYSSSSSSASISISFHSSARSFYTVRMKVLNSYVWKDWIHRV